MQIWEPSRCCCCSLRTGSLVVGSLGLIGATFGMINACVGTFALVIQQLTKLKLISCLKDEESDSCHEQVYNYVVGFCVALLTAEAAQALACSMLLYGIVKERHRLMVPYMVWCVVRLSMCLIWSVFSIIMYFNMPKVMLILLVTFIILAVVESMYLLIIRAQYFKMKQDLSERHAILEEESSDL